MLCYKMTISHNLVTNVSSWFFLEHGEFRWFFSVIYVSQGSVATYVRCGGISTQRCIANFLLSLPVKEFLKSVKIWQSYCLKFGGFLFWDTVYVHAKFGDDRLWYEEALADRKSDNDNTTTTKNNNNNNNNNNNKNNVRSYWGPVSGSKYALGPNSAEPQRCK